LFWGIRTAEAFNLPVNYLTTDKGLSNNSVLSVFQDHRGFMWIGTYDGLNRYDGTTVTVFRNRFSDTSSLSDNWVTGISEDKSGNIWLATRKGVNIFNEASNRCASVRFGERGQVLDKFVKDIQADAGGNIFIASQYYGLLFCANGSHRIIQMPMMTAKGLVNDYDVTAVKVARDGSVWCQVRNIGLCELDKTSLRLKVVWAGLDFCFAMEDGGDVIWLGTGSGIYTYDKRTGKLAHEAALNEGLIKSRVKSIFLDLHTHDLWIATEEGIRVYNLLSHVAHYISDEKGELTLSSPSVSVVYADRENRKWIGTLKGGITTIGARDKQFTNISHDAGDPHSLSSNFILSFCEDHSGTIWIGTDGTGLSKWDRKSKKFTNYQHLAGADDYIPDDFVTTIVTDKEGMVWLSTVGGGIAKYDSKGKKIRNYTCPKPTGEANPVVYTMLVDKTGGIWAGTFKPGVLYKYDPSSDVFRIVNTAVDDLFCLYQDQGGDLWGGNSMGLVEMDGQGRTRGIFDLKYVVRSVYEDHAGNFWVGLDGGGLVRFDRKLHRVAAQYTTNDGLCSNSVLNILEDKHGNLWMSTNNGIATLDVKKRKFRNYYKDDGLQGNQFSFKAALALSSGELLFGGIKGVTIFNPDSLQASVTQPAIVLLNVLVNNVPLSADGAYIVRSGAEQVEEIKVPYDKAIISLDFTAPEYQSPRKISYAYFLQGWDRQWTYAGDKKNAIYTHLSEGNYLFRVKCTDTEGGWISREATIRIQVLPPWYRSWIAYLLYTAAFVSLLWLFFRVRARQTRLKYEIKLVNLDAEKKKAIYEKEKAEREKERLMIEKEKEATERKVSFFTDISHEFRSPLSLIINPVKDLLNKDRAAEDGDRAELSTVYRNAKRLLSIVDQLLLFRKADTGRDQMKVSRLNFYDVCREVFLCFVQQARSRDIRYALEFDNKEMEVYADREKIEIVLFNIISNAIKYTEKGGMVTVAVREEEEAILVAIRDTGKGIPPETGEQLYEKFYQGKGSVKTGFGIGLFLARQFTLAHKGSIDYESRLGEGTLFTIRLLKGQEHFAKEDMIVDFGDEPTILSEITDVPMEEKAGKGPALMGAGADLAELLVTDKKSILVVEDEETMRSYLAGIFQHDYTVYEARNGEEGILSAEKLIPDIIISDIKMEGINGIDLCRSIKENPAISHIPVILLTGSTAPEIRLNGIESGADDYITKPFDKNILTARVASLLKNRTILRHYFYNEITFSKNDLKVSGEYKEFLKKCKNIIEEHMGDDGFNASSFITAMGMSRSNLLRKVKTISGLSINEFIRFIRLRKAAELFINSDANINEVAFQVGINDIKYFRQQFNKVFGMNPSAYIKRYRKILGYQHRINRDAAGSEE